MRQWYGVRTFPGYENKVQEGIKKLIEKNDLQEQIGEIFVPTYKKYTFVRRDIKLKEELIFPGYVFVNMNLTNELMYSVRGVQYIIGYAGTNEMKKKPDPITEEEVKNMKVTSSSLTTDLKIGQEIVIEGFEEKKFVNIKEINLDNEEIIADDGNVYKFIDIKKK